MTKCTNCGKEITGYSVMQPSLDEKKRCMCIECYEKLIYCNNCKQMTNHKEIKLPLVTLYECIKCEEKK